VKKWFLKVCFQIQLVPLLSGGDYPEAINVRFNHLIIDGGYFAITDLGNVGVGVRWKPSSFVSMDIVGCHFENQGGDIINWSSVSVSLLRIVDSTLLHSAESAEFSDCVFVGAQDKAGRPQCKPNRDCQHTHGEVSAGLRRNWRCVPTPVLPPCCLSFYYSLTRRHTIF
jgi:hypothetical protein